MVLTDRFAAPSTLATVISNLPEYEPEQPAGNPAWGEIAEVTPWAETVVTARVKKARMKDKDFMVSVDGDAGERVIGKRLVVENEERV